VGQGFFPFWELFFLQENWAERGILFFGVVSTRIFTFKGGFFICARHWGGTSGIGGIHFHMCRRARIDRGVRILLFWRGGLS